MGVQTLNVNRTILSAGQMLRADCEDGVQRYYDCVIFGGEEAFFAHLLPLIFHNLPGRGQSWRHADNSLHK